MVLVTHKPVWSGLLQVSWELCLSNLSLCTFFSLATFRYCNWDFFWWMSAVEMHEMQIIYSLGHFCFFTAATTTTQAPTTTTTADPEPEPTSKFSFVKCSSCRQDWKKVKIESFLSDQQGCSILWICHFFTDLLIFFNSHHYTSTFHHHKRYQHWGR